MLALAVISCILGLVGAILFIIVLMETVLPRCLAGGCLTTLLFLLLLGGHIGVNVSIGTKFGALGVAIYNLVCIILGIISIKKISGWESSSSTNWEAVGKYLHKHELENIEKYKNWQG
jgi:hypothetical protein